MSSVTRASEVSIQDLRVGAYEVPTDAPEADGTLSWDSTVIVVVEASAGESVGIGYTYADVSTAKLIDSKLAGIVHGLDAMAPQAAWRKMVGQVRNLGRPGVSSMAIAAIDTALWDLKARLLELPLCQLLGGGRECVPVYGSGGFTAYDDAQLSRQLAGWVSEGIPRVKIKVGSHPDDDPRRVRVAREAIGPDTQLFVDANGAYTRKQALSLAERFREESDVSWFEEPVSSDDLDGLRLVRDRAPAGMDVAAGEYGYDAVYFRRMLEAGAVDVQQADITRCAGVTGLMQVAGLCEGFQVPLSLHCGPAIHVHPGLSLDRLVHLEYFHDHIRIESILFEGGASLEAGALWPDLERPGNGLQFKREDAERYAV
ncbi:MAG TPA: enolase C-terminal domain-like protein [Solirubrobacteraceae bacterium]|jgi:L-alanine-DL-glutamate epimerase-like enolase superfamily enzyme|nr:enolase C-terminal domain-like protein [Solirubrobacteraceae bacterium]